MNLLITNIKSLLQTNRSGQQFVAGADMKNLPQIENAFLFIEDGKIADFGPMGDCEPTYRDGAEVIDASGKYVLPSWVDSHTHLVYAGNREGEFIDRIHGMSYEEIAMRGGGILNSAKKLNEQSEDQLYQSASRRLDDLIRLGTGAIEIKSGYGLTESGEIKMLRVVKRLKENYDMPIKATFLGAHALPIDYKNKKSEYLDLVINQILPQIVEEGLADYIDIFCEKGYFDLDDTRRILEAGKKYGLPAKPHVNQFHAFGGIELSVEYGALSVDHLEVLNPEDIEALKGSKTMPVALPGCSLFLSIPYTPARQLIDAGLPLALATDYNPGSSPSGNMNLVVSLACVKMKMTPEEAINAATLNSAFAMGIESEMGSIDKGKRGSVMITEEIPSYGFLPYSFGQDHIDQVILNGKPI